MDIEDKIKEWEEKVYKEWIKKRAERKKEFTTFSGIKVNPLYTPLDVRGEYLEKIGLPGQFPFTRGIYPNMYRGRIWTIRQYAGFGSAEETNSRFRRLLDAGQTGLSMAFDLPTQLGLDPDHELAFAEVGVVGVSMFHWKEMDLVMSQIPLNKVTVSMTINATAMELLSMLIATAESRGIDKSALDGTVQNDILKEYIARKNFIYPPEPSMKYAVDIIEYSAKYLPKWHPISISGYHIREAGADAALEVAFTLADGIEYVRRTLERGISVDEFAPHLSFFFAAYTDIFEEVAKFRAARRMWAKIMKDWFKAKNPESLMLRFHTQTGGAELTAQQPEINIIRTTLQALAAVLGGTQSLHVNSYDEALALPTEKSAKIAIRVQQIIAYESGATSTVDPLGGSYYVEWLTDEIEERAWKIIDQVEKMGGMIKAIEYGFPQSQIAESAYRIQKRIEEGDLIKVGVNMFYEPDWVGTTEIFRVNPEIREKVLTRLKKYRNERDTQRVKDSLNKLVKVAERNSENLFPYVLDCIKVGATIGEISGALREVWGEYKEPSIF
ncbi:methylmalonyl-CoA mutase [Sulfolobus sp. A20]|uniref:acyl-CoA mutase large subunit family protein n=1 Tax=Saccharolobus sp. A20 TaxID=1891280 RepID=UPI000845C10D|nr:methylmalonyl-CoA mutase family protein [Sulfolobus sp. A20]TRM78406.1 methylmalonyl-CoA mutase [Sulfolobus sp. A20-N-F8]TRM83662.1 methylmalonyl-CoA mutase [Sulfolobus sp. A20-N-F6]TRM85189.1 methylmalonyl-CoA mutase [Sulfolobus sp. F3]TRM98743.1 methylmalonyl-CoA mutase [Sulfolobus sp. F1]AOL17109.1 methylmalonyl-CoA mutase [Sulfolobus sp. A20]